MQGKTVVITGASTGIGKVAAVELARMGADVTLVCQNPQRGQRALAEVAKAGSDERAHLRLADFSSLAEVRRLAAELAEAHERIDVLVNNAGVILWTRTITRDGYEATFAVNHLAPFLLTSLLRPRLEAAPAARVVNTASGAHFNGRIDFDSFRGERRYKYFEAYCQSKLANVLFTQELAERLAGTPVTANCLHPGFVPNTNLVRKFPLGNHALRLLGFIPGFTTPEEGARTIVHLAASPDVVATSGKYFLKQRERHVSRHARDRDLQKRLWEVSAALVGLET
jgi:NAD(P)-dependent dehydrogenase (short-subunit alcohol dehydrogenase family)